MSFLEMFVVSIVVLQASLFVTTIYLHRAMCHRSLELHPVVANLMHAHLSLFTGIVPREWIAVHRKHHHFSDKDGDPHSPYLFGMWQVFFNNFSMYRKEKGNEGTIRKYTPDHRPDFVDRIPGNRYGVVGGLAIFMLMFGVWWGLAAWSFHVVAYIFLNAGVNSFCHMIGRRNFDNKATNFQLWALVTAGEGLHNNHHEHPSSAKLALRSGEFDPAWPIIWLLAKCGLAKIRQESLTKAA